MNQVRIHGDPFGEGAAASLLRSFLRLALGNEMRCALSLSAVRGRLVGEGEHEICLTDGVRDLRVGTRLPPAEVDLLLRAAGESVAATAPLVVFAPADTRDDCVRLAGLEWPRASTVLGARDGATAVELLERVRAELRWAGTEHPAHGLEARELAPWLALPPLAARGPIVHVGGPDFGHGTDLVVDAWCSQFAAGSNALRLVLPDADALFVGELQRRLGALAAQVEIVVSGFEPCHARDAVAIVMPMRRLLQPRALMQALASGRPVCASRFAATAPIVARSGVCFPIGGRNVPECADVAPHFAPDAQAVLASLKQAVGEAALAAATGRRARQHVVEELTRGRPSSPPPPMAVRASARPVVVLEAPFFETSSSAELSIETALALQQRCGVELRLLASTPMRTDLGWLRQRAPSLLPLFCRDPGRVDLWLSAGWPVRAQRPACRHWAVRVDWEYGALPLQLLPHVTEAADSVIVHSEHVRRSVVDAGRDAGQVHLVPHGVDACMHEQAPADAEILQWKQGRPVILFCGGLVWRKGFDVFLRTVLAAREQGYDFGVVVKTVGQDQHYGRFHLGELVQRVQRTPGTPPLRLITADLSRPQMAALYNACDLLLHPYRGEGFCMPVLEARACGLPVIATAGGATTALMQGAGAFEIESSKRGLELPEAHVSAPWVLEPDAGHALQLLRGLLAELPARQDEARRFARSVRTSFRWSEAAAAIEQLAIGAMPGGRRPVVGETIVTLPSIATKPDLPLPAMR